MEKTSTATKVGPWQGVVVGVDLGDKQAKAEVEGPDGTLLEVTSVPMTSAALARYFSRLGGARVVIEAGTHSPWVSRLVEAQGCQCVVVNPRRVRLIAESTGKSDDSDPGVLRFLGRVGLGNLNPVYHRSEQQQQDMMLLNARALLVKQRTALVSHVRFVAKSMGRRRETWESVTVKGRKQYLMPAELVPALKPLLDEAEVLTWRIAEYKKAIEKVIRERYPEAQRLQQIRGVGPITALTFVLTIHDASRFRRSRQVGAYLGFVPKRRQSGKKDPELGITKAGNAEARRLLVQCSQYIVSHPGADSDLRRWALTKTEGGKARYRRGIIALARKLAVVMHRLMITGADYEPFRQREEVATAA
jgi:transposase